MNQADECHRKAEALATLAEMFPELRERYRAREQHWRRLEAQARDAANSPPGVRRRTPATVD